MIFDLGARSNAMVPNESTYMISFMSTIQMEPLSLIVFEIFVKNAYLTIDLEPRSKVKWAFFSNISKTMEIGTPFVL